MSFTNQKPFEVDAEQHRSFTRHKKRFGCVLCGHIFSVGDTARWVYANGSEGVNCGNFFICSKCDGDDVLQRGNESFKLAKEVARRWGIYGPDWQ